MKQIKYLLLILCLMFIGIIGVNAETIDASIKLVGRNTFGRELEIEVDCKNAGDSECYITDTKWYYNDSNSTEGGTEIVGSDVGGSGYANYYIEEKMVGKYIYVVATISSYDNDYESITLKEITDASTNVTAMVDDYIEYIDNSGYSIDATATHEVAAHVTLKLNGITKSENMYVYLSNGEKPIVTQTEKGCSYPETSEDDYSKYKAIYNSEINVADDWYLLKGYTKAYILEYVHDSKNGGYNCNVTENPIDISKQSIPTLGTRYQYYLFSENEKTLSTFPLFPFDGKNGSHKLITKIGIINDNSLLKKLSKNTNDSLSSLLEYAKKSEGKTFKYLDSASYNVDIGSFDVIDGAYYYVYTTYEDTNGIYRNFDDVIVVMGDAGMLVNDVKWTSSNNETIWEKFVEEFKKMVKNNTEDVTVEYDDTSMTIKYQDYITKFTYENGIVSYVKDDNIKDDKLLVDSLYQGFAITTFLNMFNYDLEKAYSYLQNNPNLTIDKDGFEYVIKEFKYKDNTGTISGDAFTTLKFDLINGLKNYKAHADEKIPEEDVPPTGLAIGAAIVLSLMTLSGIGLIIYNKTTRKNKLNNI